MSGKTIIFAIKHNPVRKHTKNRFTAYTRLEDRFAEEVLMDLIHAYCDRRARENPIHAEICGDEHLVIDETESIRDLES